MTQTSASTPSRAIPREEAKEWLTKSFDWIDIVSRIRFGKSVNGVSARVIKAVAFRAAIYANADGTMMLAGIARIAVVCQIDYKTAKVALGVLRGLRLLTKVGSGSGPQGGRRHHADEYWLTTPPDLLDRVELWSPDRMDKEVEVVRGVNKGVAGVRRTRNCVDNASQSCELQGSDTPATHDGLAGVAGKTTLPNEELRGNPRQSCGVDTPPLPTTDRSTTALTDQNHRPPQPPVDDPQAVEDQISEKVHTEPTSCQRPGCQRGYILTNDQVVRCTCGGRG